MSSTITYHCDEKNCPVNAESGNRDGWVDVNISLVSGGYESRHYCPAHAQPLYEMFALPRPVEQKRRKL